MPRKKVKSESGSCNGKSTSVKTKVEASVSENTRHRDSRKRGPAKDENENSPCKMFKGCDKAGCNSQTPLCHANVLKSCLPQKNTSRWYHISNSEHFCNECFEYYYRSGKAGYQKYSDWKELWKKTADKTEPSFKAFVLDQVLPYWLQCILCKKWRQLPANTEITSDFISKFKCNEKVEGIKKKSNCCNVPEDEIVLEVKEPEWHSSLLWPAYLKNSPAAQFLGAYFPNRVGLSPTCKECIQAKEVYLESRANKRCNSSNEENGIKSDNDYSLLNIPGLHRNLQPFYQPDEPLKAWCIRPDEMEADELAEFPSYEKRAIFYLGTRNLIIALWNLNFKKWLTLQDVSNHLICRGLVRIHCIQLAEKILNFLTRKGSINIGFIKPPNDFTLIPIKKKESVIVVGSGVSGLSAAYQLSRFGFDVTILEGNNRIGGRISDETSMGACVGRGAQIITGVVNNPLILLSEQARLPYRIMKDKCDLYTDKGKIVDYVMDQKIDQHFNSTLEDIAIWKKDKEVDVPLYEKLMELSRLKCKENNETFNDEERQLFDFYVANLEYACGSVLKNLSTLHWDQNEAFPQFAGQHALLPNGYSAIFFKIAENLNVKLNTTVINIDYSKDKIKVETNEGDFFADKVIVTISLALMQTNCINFKPPLPDKKINAIDSLGSGLIEKIAVQFSRRFWDKNLIDADMFGYIPVKPHEKGLFGVIYDMTPQNRDKENGPHILMTCATSDAVNFVHNKPPLETVRYFLKVLRRIFPDEDVPEPIDYFVTNWGDDTNFHMAYSYVKIGGSGESYDGLAEAVDDKLFFAGEATNRQFPQTVTGAFISGLREANKITSSVLKVKN